MNPTPFSCTQSCHTQEYCACKAQEIVGQGDADESEAWSFLSLLFEVRLQWLFWNGLHDYQGMIPPVPAVRGGLLLPLAPPLAWGHDLPPLLFEGEAASGPTLPWKHG